jgi:hypothetical protein
MGKPRTKYLMRGLPQKAGGRSATEVDQSTAIRREDDLHALE